MYVSIYTHTLNLHLIAYEWAPSLLEYCLIFFFCVDFCHDVEPLKIIFLQPLGLAASSTDEPLRVCLKRAF